MIPALDYDLRAVQGNQRGVCRLEIALQHGVMAKARATIMAIVRGGPPAGQRLQELRRFLYAFEATHRYAPGARHQFIELSRYAASQSKRHLKAQLGADTDKSLPRIKVVNTLIVPSSNPFLEPASLVFRHYLGDRTLGVRPFAPSGSSSRPPMPLS